MITEDYVSFEIAKLLKEKGFDEHCFCINYPLPEGGHHNIILPNLLNNSMIPFTDEYKNVITIPTIQMTMKWLRNVHGVYYDIQLLLGDKAEKYGDLQLGVYQLSSSGAYVWKDWIYADTYVELYENCIKYCLENLV